MKYLSYTLLILIASCGRPKSPKNLSDDSFYAVQLDNQPCANCFYAEFKAKTLTITFGNIDPVTAAPSVQGCFGSATFRAVDYRDLDLPTESGGSGNSYDVVAESVVGQCFATNQQITIRRIDTLKYEFTFNSDNEQFYTIIKRRN